MSVANSRRQGSVPQHGFEWAGAMARMRRAGGSARAGRRSALLNVLTASYANTSRTGRTAETRTSTGGNTDRS
jgi:hypothetical protein